MADFRQLKVWQKAHQVTLDIIELLNNFREPKLMA